MYIKDGAKFAMAPKLNRFLSYYKLKMFDIYHAKSIFDFTFLLVDQNYFLDKNCMLNRSSDTDIV